MTVRGADTQTLLGGLAALNTPLGWEAYGTIVGLSGANRKLRAAGSDTIERLTRERDLVLQSFEDICDDLGCAHDNEEALTAIAALKDRIATVERERDDARAKAFEEIAERIEAALPGLAASLLKDAAAIRNATEAA